MRSRKYEDGWNLNQEWPDENEEDKVEETIREENRVITKPEGIKRKSLWKRLGLKVGLAGLILTTGCMTKMPIQKYEHGKNFYSEIAARGSLTLSQSESELDWRNRSVSVHPADGGNDRFKGRGVTLKDPDDYTLFDVRLGLEASTGNKHLRIKAGVDGDLDSGFYHSMMKLQPLPLEEGYRSYGGYTFAKEPSASLEPFLGAELRLGKVFLLGEYSQPYAKYYHELFDHRWGFKQVFQEDSWEGRGEAYTAGIGMHFPRENGQIGLLYTSEEYKPEINGIEEKVTEKSIRAYISGDF